MKSAGIAKFLLGAVLLAGVRLAVADSAGLSLGEGDHADAVELSLQKDMRRPLREYDASRLTGHLEFAARYIRGHVKSEPNEEILAVGITPVLRLQSLQHVPAAFVEAGIGGWFLSQTSIYESRRFSTSFQFGELLGVGLRFGPTGAYEVGLRVEHMSNGGIKQPNDGINFAVIRFAYHYN